MGQTKWSRQQLGIIYSASSEVGVWTYVVSAMFRMGSYSDLEESFDWSEENTLMYYSSLLSGPYFGNLHFLMGRTLSKVNFIVFCIVFMLQKYFSYLMKVFRKTEK